MYNFKTLRCFNCASVIVNLPESEIIKLNGLTFRCECCNVKNLLQGLKFNGDPKDSKTTISCSYPSQSFK